MAFNGSRTPHGIANVMNTDTSFGPKKIEEGGFLPKWKNATAGAKLAVLNGFVKSSDLPQATGTGDTPPPDIVSFTAASAPPGGP